MNVPTERIAAGTVASPWSVRTRIGMVLWEFCWAFFCQWTPKPLNAWRLVWLRLFGAKLYGTPFVHQRARIQIPWHLVMQDRACLGDRANVYSLGRVTIEEGAVIAQETYLCTGTHDFDEPGLPLLTREIRVRRNAFVGARAMVLPGVTVGAHAIVGACSVVTRDVEPWTISAGNPCRLVRRRKVNDEKNSTAGLPAATG
jgi:putative colanic acid biosynthesis acetyltransferase WcaF